MKRRGSVYSAGFLVEDDQSEEFEDDRPGEVPGGGLDSPAIELASTGFMSGIAAIRRHRQHTGIDHEHP